MCVVVGGVLTKLGDLRFAGHQEQGDLRLAALLSAPEVLRTPCHKDGGASLTPSENTKYTGLSETDCLPRNIFVIYKIKY